MQYDNFCCFFHSSWQPSFNDRWYSHLITRPVEACHVKRHNFYPGDMTIIYYSNHHQWVRSSLPWWVIFQPFFQQGWGSYNRETRRHWEKKEREQSTRQKLAFELSLHWSGCGCFSLNVYYIRALGRWEVGFQNTIRIYQRKFSVFSRCVSWDRSCILRRERKLVLAGVSCPLSLTSRKLQSHKTATHPHFSLTASEGIGIYHSPPSNQIWAHRKQKWKLKPLGGSPSR